MNRQSSAKAQARFDLRLFSDAVDKERDRQGLSWAALSRQVGVAASTIKRFREGDDAEADGVLALIRWLGSTPEAFVHGPRNAGVHLPGGDGFIRVDMTEVATASGDPSAARRSRTTIQNLAAVAQESDRSIAALTRLSDT